MGFWGMVYYTLVVLGSREENTTVDVNTTLDPKPFQPCHGKANQLRSTFSTWEQGSGCRCLGAKGFRVQGLLFGVQGLGSPCVEGESQFQRRNCCATEP